MHGNGWLGIDGNDWLGFNGNDWLGLHGNLQQFNIDIIPRYLLFDKEGKLINDDAPHPNNSELRYLLNKLISEN